MDGGPNITTSGEVPPASLTALPNELKTEIAKYLSTREHKALVLVSRDWALITLSMLWGTLYANQALRDRHQFRALTSPNSNIIKHVTNIVLNGPKRTPEDIRFGRSAKCWSPMLLGKIPKGQLRGYQFEKESVIESDVMDCLSLLENHPIRSLVVKANFWTRLNGDPFLPPNLISLRRLVVDLPPAGNRISFFLLGDFRFPLKQLETLKFRIIDANWEDQQILDFGRYRLLDLEDEHDTEHDSSKISNDRDVKIFPDLKALQFHCMKINNIVHLAHRINVEILCELTILHAGCEPQFLVFLATEFSVNASSLHTLCIIKPHLKDIEDFHISLQLLLCSFQGLRRIHIDYPAKDRMDVHCIVHHGATLQDLLFINGGASEQSLTGTDLEEIVEGCPSLEQLCLDFDMFYTFGPEGKTLLPSNKSDILPMTEFEKAVRAIATSKSLKILRFANHPRLNLPDGPHKSLNADEICGDFQKDANEIKNVLDKFGSNVKMLAFVPSTKKHTPYALKKTPWPNFLYSLVHRADEDGHEQLVAEPLIKWRIRFPHASSLQDLDLHIHGNVRDAPQFD